MKGYKSVPIYAHPSDAVVGGFGETYILLSLCHSELRSEGGKRDKITHGIHRYQETGGLVKLKHALLPEDA
jgi:hypothetical protein